MDIFSHAFWSAVAAKSANSKIKPFKKRPMNVGWATIWGVAPDIFAFTPVIISVALSFLLDGGNISAFKIDRPSDIEPMGADTLFIYRLTRQLYDIGHSAIIFAAVFAIVALLFRKPKWVMLGWLFHILIDIPTHSYKFYPTPVFWPLSSREFNGISWATPWFLILDVSAIIIVSLIYFLKRKKRI